jgi:carbamoyltransferase
MKGACLGPSYSAEDIRGALDASGAIYREVDDERLYDEVVTALTQGKVVGWFGVRTARTWQALNSGRRAGVTAAA